MGESRKTPTGSGTLSTEPDQVPRTIKEFLRMTFFKILQQRKWFLLPVWVMLAVVAVMLVLTGNSHLLPVIYLAF